MRTPTIQRSHVRNSETYLLLTWHTAASCQTSPTWLQQFWDRADGDLYYPTQPDDAIALSAGIRTCSDLFCAGQPLLGHFWQHHDVQEFVPNNMGFAEEQEAERWPEMRLNKQCQP